MESQIGWPYSTCSICKAIRSPQDSKYNSTKKILQPVEIVMSLASDMLFTQAEYQTTLLYSAEGNLYSVLNETNVGWANASKSTSECVQKHQPVLQLKESS